jgi:hypothetical protein
LTSVAARGDDFLVGLSNGKLYSWNNGDWKLLFSTKSEIIMDIEAGPSDEIAIIVNMGGVTVFRYDGEEWEQLGPSYSTQGNHDCIAYGGNGDIFVAGYFSEIGDAPVNNLACWDGEAWQNITNKNSGFVIIDEIASGPQHRFAIAGTFRTVEGVPARHIAEWDGSQWHSAGDTSITRNTARIVFGPEGNMFIYNRYSWEPDVPYAPTYDREQICMRDNTGWKIILSHDDDLYDGSSNAISIDDIAVDGANNVYAAGNYYGRYNGFLEKIIKWNGTGWSDVGFGEDGTVRCLGIHDSCLYAGGYYYYAGGKSTGGMGLASISVTPLKNSVAFRSGSGNFGAVKIISHGRQLSLSGVLPRYTICIYDLSGRLLHKGKGVERIVLPSQAGSVIITAVTGDKGTRTVRKILMP